MKLEGVSRIVTLAAALRRIDADEFGLCFACGEKISVRGSVDIPVITFCIDCKY